MGHRRRSRMSPASPGRRQPRAAAPRGSRPGGRCCSSAYHVWCAPHPSPRRAAGWPRRRADQSRWPQPQPQPLSAGGDAGRTTRQRGTTRSVRRRADEQARRRRDDRRGDAPEARPPRTPNRMRPETIRQSRAHDGRPHARAAVCEAGTRMAPAAPAPAPGRSMPARRDPAPARHPRPAGLGCPAAADAAW